ncbi:MAG: exodeoxyribonuclease VII large subunit [Clostridia bacterium]|nr:exodeoxyribonuclease VII large subunit [Clostridia bacterium]
MEQNIKVATVSQINGYIKKILDSNIILNNIWIKGEISNCKLHYSGHLYLTLKDEGSVLKAVMFKGANKDLSFKPEDGMKVLARGRISAYESGGVYQLYIEEMIPDGVGALYVAYEQLKAKLASEGLFDERFKKAIPKYPEKIGVVTAATGAAVRDIIHVITRRFPYAEIILYPSLVQGPEAAANIAAAIEYFNNANMVDTLIVGRGGGSIEDLWAFNEEIVARAVFASKIPVISAVGHETDFTITDFVADLRAPTPSAAAELSVPSQIELMNRIRTMEGKISFDIAKRLEREAIRLKNIKLKNPHEKIQDYSITLDNRIKQLSSNFMMNLMRKKEILGSICGKLDAMSPLSVMSRGYAIPIDASGNIIKTAKALKSGTNFTLKLSDGEKECIAK